MSSSWEEDAARQAPRDRLYELTADGAEAARVAVARFKRPSGRLVRMLRTLRCFLSADLHVSATCRIGGITAQARTPRFRLLPVLSLLALLAVAIIALAQSGFASPLGSLAFLVADVVALALYSAQIWRQEGLGERYTFWQLVWIGAWYPGQLRAALQQLPQSADPAATPPAS